MMEQRHYHSFKGESKERTTIYPIRNAEMKLLDRYRSDQYPQGSYDCMPPDTMDISVGKNHLRYFQCLAQRQQKMAITHIL